MRRLTIVATRMSAAFVAIALPFVVAGGQDSALAMKPFADYLNELSDRRRLNTFFPNEQSPFHGVRVGYVNVGTGNLTFLRRDLVRISRAPLVFGRVFDSQIAENDDFGPGWKLAMLESIEKSGNDWIYTDSSGSRYLLRSASNGRKLEFATPFYTDVIDISRDDDGVIAITYRNLRTKSFTPHKDNYLLSAVVDNNGNQIAFQYADGRLSAVSNEASRITIARDGAGRVVGVSDDIGRTVSYGYDNKGRLETVTDLGGFQTIYRYDGRDRLIRVVDPSGNTALSANYTGDRIHHARVRSQKHTYSFNSSVTTVQDGTGITSTYRQNERGLTDFIQNAVGHRTELEFDTKNRVASLMENGHLRASFAYDELGNLSSVVRFDAAGDTDLMLEHNWHKRLLRVDRSDGESLAIKYDLKGNVLERAVGSKKIRYEYNAAGDVTKVELDNATYLLGYTDQGIMSFVERQGSVRMNFDINPAGRLVSVRIDDTALVDYTYDPLGFRSGATFHNGDESTFDYDTSGNLVAISSGEGSYTREVSYEIGDDNEITRIVDTAGYDLTIDYDHRGNPLTIRGATDSTEFIYDYLNRLKEVRQNGVPIASHDYGPQEPDLRIQYDDRTFVALQDSVRGSAIYGRAWEIVGSRNRGSLYGPVAHVPDLEMFDLGSSWGLRNPDVSLLASLERSKVLITGDVVADLINLHRASNVSFLPPEYEAANCCVTCPGWDPNCQNSYCEDEPTFIGVTDDQNSDTSLMFGYWPNSTGTAIVRIDFVKYMTERYQTLVFGSGGQISQTLKGGSTALSISGFVPSTLPYTGIGSVSASHQYIDGGTPVGQASMIHDTSGGFDDPDTITALLASSATLTFGTLNVSGSAAVSSLMLTGHPGGFLTSATIGPFNTGISVAMPPHF